MNEQIRNKLKGDIFEAFELLKIHSDTYFRFSQGAAHVAKQLVLLDELKPEAIKLMHLYKQAHESYWETSEGKKQLSRTAREFRAIWKRRPYW